MNVWLGGIQKESMAETNGISYNIYFSGCSIRCPDCHNKEFWEMENGTLTDIDSIVDDICGSLELVDSVCILGGEPTDQPEALEYLLNRLQELPIDIWLFTGREFEELNTDVVEMCDVIKCGMYLSDAKDYNTKLNSNLASSNQYYINKPRR